MKQGFGRSGLSTSRACGLLCGVLVASSLGVGVVRSAAVPVLPEEPAGRSLVAGLTTPVQQVWQNADGTQTVELSAVPVRARKSGVWVDIDTSLVADGGNGVRIDQGFPGSPQLSQQVDHVVVRSGGKVIGPDGKPIVGSLSENPQAHIPLTDWMSWSSWSAP